MVHSKPSDSVRGMRWCRSSRSMMSAPYRLKTALAAFDLGATQTTSGTGRGAVTPYRKALLPPLLWPSTQLGV